MLLHVRSVFPQEAVGLLGGTGSSVAQVLPLPNIARPGMFLADPRAQFLAERSLRDAGLTPVGIYHSHPKGGAQLSPADRIVAQLRPSVIHVVVALASPTDVCEIRAFEMRGGRSVEVSVHLLKP
jgi:[CysO sulfur-carrier protein]-S-L-cysteine hydrolase